MTTTTPAQLEDLGSDIAEQARAYGVTLVDWERLDDEALRFHSDSAIVTVRIGRLVARPTDISRHHVSAEISLDVFRPMRYGVTTATINGGTELALAMIVFGLLSEGEADR